MTGGEPNFQNDVDEMEASVEAALNELTNIKAYTLKADELRNFKAAQYALRNLSPEHGLEDVEAVFDD